MTWMTDSTSVFEHEIILNWVDQSSSILDLGCGTGKLMSSLVKHKKVKAQGIEIDESQIFKCVELGLSVFQQDIDTGLIEFEDNSFDYVILAQTLQQVKRPDFVLKEALRVGRKVIISFPNFVYFPVRFQIFFRGKVPITPSLPHEWYNTPNLHFLGISDFIEYCVENKIKIEDAVFLRKNRKVKFFPNLFSENGIFLISKE